MINRRTVCALIALTGCVLEAGRCAAQSRSASHIEQGAEVIRAEAEAWGTSTGLAPQYIYAMATMNYVQSRVSPAMYWRLNRQGKLPSLLDAESALKSGAGLCGTHASVFAALLRECLPEVDVRDVQFYLHRTSKDRNENHVAVEVFYHGKWRYFDATWGVVVLRDEPLSQDDLLGAAEIRKLTTSNETWKNQAQINEIGVGYRTYLTANQDPLKHLHWPDTDLLAGDGTIHLRPNSRKNEYLLADIAGNVGFVPDHCGTFRNIRVHLAPLDWSSEKPGQINITITGTANGNEKGELTITSGATTLRTIPWNELKPGATFSLRVETSDEVILQVSSQQNRGYVGLRRVEIGQSTDRGVTD